MQLYHREFDQYRDFLCGTPAEAAMQRRRQEVLRAISAVDADNGKWGWCAEALWRSGTVAESKRADEPCTLANRSRL